jgi:glycosyltransferase involved in cell wall biosynthesis
MREPLVRTQVIPYLRELRKDGHDITLLTFEPGPDGATAAEELDGGIRWSSLRYHKRPSVPATAFDVLNGARLIRKIVQNDQIDILHARSHVPMLMAALARKTSRTKPKLLFDIRGFFPEEYVDAGIWPEGGWLFRRAKRVERWLMKEADAFVVLTEKARQILFENEVRPVEVIPCCVDLGRFACANSLSRESVRSELGIGDRPVAVYVGAFGGWYLTKETADFFGAFKRARPKGFALILTQSRPEMIEPLLRERGFADGDFLIRKVLPSELPRYLSTADTAVSFIKPCYSKQASSPTKNAEYLACGLPIIANSGVGDVDDLISKNQIGAIVNEFAPDAYLTALKQVEALGDVGDPCREVAQREFDLETVGGRQYRKLYSKLVRPA